MAETISAYLIAGGMTAATPTAVGSALTIGGTVATAAVQAGVGVQQANQFEYYSETQAALVEADKQARLADTAEQSLAAVKELQRVNSLNRVLMSSAGLDLSTGSAPRINEESSINASRSLAQLQSRRNQISSTADFEKESILTMGRLRRRASLLAGFGGAGGTALTGLSRISRRGSGSGTPSNRGGGTSIRQLSYQ